MKGEEAEGIYCIWNTKGYLKTWWKASVQAKEILFFVQVRVESVFVVRLRILKEIWYVTRQDIVTNQKIKEQAH